MMYTTMPREFNPKFDIVSCFLEYDGEILLLLRQPHKPQGNTFGVPAGKVEGKEEIYSAMGRELKQETGVRIPPSNLIYIEVVYVRYPDYDFRYHMFRHLPKEKPKIRINLAEHKEFRWVTPQNSLKLPLIRDLDACIKRFYRI